MKAYFRTAVSQWLSTTPLRHPRFRLFYVGSIGTALGYTMQTTVAAWVMATLTPSELMVALVQTASMAPALLFGLIAGALADIVDRRRLILVTQWLLLVSTAVLGVAALAGVVGPALLLALTFLVGAAFSLYLPAQLASINDLVSREDLPRAVTLGAVSFNFSRALGPAIAGAIAAWLGSGSALVASSLFFVGMIYAVYGLPKRERVLPGVPESLRSAVLSGMRFARHSLAMRALLIRNVSFSVCAGAFWALLPVVARDLFHLGAGGFGLLSASFGTGAIVGALFIAGQIQRRSLNTVVTAGVMLWVASVGVLAATDLVVVAVASAFATGAAWVSVLASIGAGVQSSAPAWVRARAVSVNLVTQHVSLAVGSALWGAVAVLGGIRIALGASVATMLLLLAITRRSRVALGNEADVTPGTRLPELAIAVEPRPDDGPVLIQIEYRIDVEHRDGFLRAIHAVEPARRRNGASSWRVFRDLGEDGLFVERFVIASWAEYVRLRARSTMSDRGLQEQVEQAQRAGVPVRISRLIGIQRQGDAVA